jgi:hypothetical protein
VIGILGPDPFGALLDDTVAGKTVGGRPIRVRRLAAVDEAVECHLIFVSSAERRLDDVIEALGATPTLTVGESEAFIESGGMIGFVIEHEGVRIDINLDAARRAGLEVSSQLLRVARTIRQGGKRQAP